MRAIVRAGRYRLWLVLVLIGYGDFAMVGAQPPGESGGTELYAVRWIDQFAASRDLGKARSIGQRVLGFLLGEKETCLVKPLALLAGDSGRLWIADQGAHALMWVDPETRQIKMLEAVDRQGLPSPAGVCFGAGNEIFLSDSRRNRIFRQQGAEALRILNDTLTLQQPTGIAYDPFNAQLWVAETAAHRLAVLDRAGNRVHTVGRRGRAPGEFNFPTYLWIDRAGNVYVVDAMNFRVQILSPAGEVLSVFGASGDASGYFARPRGIATDTLGHIYVVDGLFHTVQVFDRAGNFLTHFGKQGRGAGEFWLPAGIYIDAANRIYVADTYNSRIQMFQLVEGAEDEP